MEAAPTAGYRLGYLLGQASMALLLLASPLLAILLVGAALILTAAPAAPLPLAGPGMAAMAEPLPAAPEPGPGRDHRRGFGV